MTSVTSTAAWFVVRRTMGQGPALITRTTELSMWGKIFVPTVLVQGLTTTGLSLSLAVVSHDCLACIVLALFTLAILFASYFAIEAVRTENVYQLFAYVAASSTGMLGIVLCATEDDIPGLDMRKTFTSLTTEGGLLRTALVSAAALQLIGYLLALLTCCGTGELRGFGMRMYKKVGTDPALIDRYRRYQQFCSCLKLDLLFQLSLITVCVLGFDTFSWQWWLVSLFHLPIALVWLPLGLGGMRRESPGAVSLLVLLGTIQPLLLTVELLGRERHRSPDDPLENSTCTNELRDHFPFESPLLDFCYGAALSTRLLLLGLALAARRNFGNGLRERVHFPQQSEHLHGFVSQCGGSRGEDDSTESGTLASAPFLDHSFLGIGASMSVTPLSGATLSDALLGESGLGGSSSSMPATPARGHGAADGGAGRGRVGGGTLERIASEPGGSQQKAEGPRRTTQ